MKFKYVKLKLGIAEIEVSGDQDHLDKVALNLLRQTLDLAKDADAPVPAHEALTDNVEIKSSNSTNTFTEFIELVEPKSNVDLALATGVWLQKKEQKENFTAREASSLLASIGRNIPNITNALASPRKSKPALVITNQNTRSAEKKRKVYQVTETGIKTILKKINQEFTQ